MSEQASGTVVRDNPEQSRYEALVDGAVAGFATYQRRDGTITFLHTEVDDAYEGHGIGGTIVRESLDDVRSQGLKVRPVCPFYKRFFAEHPGYADLLV
jgi:predicted GNAT family acetyltransferase